MKIKSVIHRTSETPIPVYDATSPKYHNYVLANGCVVHNTAKLARDKNYQATFSLKGKPLNVMEATKDKVNSNKEIAGIFAGIGLDLGTADFEIEFKVTQDSGAVVIIDGQELYDLEKDEIIKIKIATKKAKMLHRSSRDFFKVLSEKLRWGN
jgi:hypothetical protein